MAAATQVRLTLPDGTVVDADLDALTLAVEAGPSGALQVTETAGAAVIDVVTAVLPIKAAANIFTGLNTFDLGAILTPRAPPATPQDGQIWYDSGTGKFRCREGGVTRDCTGGSSVGSIRVYDVVAAVDVSDPSGRTFVLPAPAASLVVHRDGIRQRPILSGRGDYLILDPQTIQFSLYYAGQAGASVLADYNPL